MKAEISTQQKRMPSGAAWDESGSKQTLNGVLKAHYAKFKLNWQIWGTCRSFLEVKARLLGTVSEKIVAQISAIHCLITIPTGSDPKISSWAASRKSDSMRRRGSSVAP